MLRSTRLRRAAVVPVVAAPRLVADERDGQPSPSGRPKRASARRRKSGRRASTTALDPVDRDRVAVVPGGDAGGERSRAREQRLELRRRGVEDGLRGAVRAEVEAGGDVLEVGQAVAGQGARLRLEGDELRRRASGGGRALPPRRGGAREARRRRATRSAGERGVLPRRRRAFRSAGPEVAVDEPGDVPVQAKGEEEVVARRPGRERGTSARPPTAGACGGLPSSLHLLRSRRAQAVRVGVVAGGLLARLPHGRRPARPPRAGRRRPRPVRSARLRASRPLPTRRHQPGLLPAPRPSPGRRRRRPDSPAERHPLPLDRVEAHPQRGGLLAATSRT